MPLRGGYLAKAARQRVAGVAAGTAVVVRRLSARRVVDLPSAEVAASDAAAAALGAAMDSVAAVFAAAIASPAASLSGRASVQAGTTRSGGLTALMAMVMATDMD